MSPLIFPSLHGHILQRQRDHRCWKVHYRKTILEASRISSSPWEIFLLMFSLLVEEPPLLSMMALSLAERVWSCGSLSVLTLKLQSECFNCLSTRYGTRINSKLYASPLNDVLSSFRTSWLYHLCVKVKIGCPPPLSVQKIIPVNCENHTSEGLRTLVPM